MTAKVFFDTNVLVYAATGTGQDERKRKRALALVESQDFGTSAQVLQEFFVTVVRKAARPLAAAEALEWIEQWAAFPCQAIDQQLVRIAIEHAERYAISFWDAAILAAAEALGAQTVYSEDLNDGQQYGRVRVVNPFLPLVMRKPPKPSRDCKERHSLPLPAIAAQ
jgi:predicted nucleic acid-binding protein